MSRFIGVVDVLAKIIDGDAKPGPIKRSRHVQSIFYLSASDKAA